MTAGEERFRHPGPRQGMPGKLLARHFELPDPEWAELVYVTAAVMASPSMSRLGASGIRFALHA